MDNAIIQALRRARQAYMTNVGEPTAQLVGGGVRGYLGLDAPEYADSRGMEAYRNAQAIANTPVVGAPAMAARAGTRAAPAVAKALREHSKGFQEYNRALGPAGASQAIVWHGSPHKFDRFDASKIGTGEGNQAYGHGLYLAEIPDVAGSYIQAGRNVGFTNFDDPIRLANKAFGNAQGNTQAALKLLDDAISSAKPGSRQNNLIFAKRVIERGDQTASLYKVDLPAPLIARMVDWDKPLSQQAPEVQAALNKLPADVKAHIGIGKYDDLKGGIDIVKPLGGLVGDAKVPGMLRQAGIPGIRYLDGGSRGAGQGTSNFVVFPGEEAALTILERNNEIINALRKKKQQ